METEKKIVEYILNSKFEQLPEKPIDIIETVVLTNLGSIIAGATAEECQKVLDLVRVWGGKPEATILVHGGKVSACNAALANGTMARVLDFEDCMVPGGAYWFRILFGKPGCC